MAEIEKELENLEEDEITQTGEETPKNDEDDAGEGEITYEQAMKWKEDLKKASRKLAEIKKQEKQAPKEKPTENNDLELRLFFIENPEFKEHKEGIIEVLKDQKYKNLTPEEALAIYKLNKPKESSTVVKDMGGIYKPKPKSLGEMDDKDAINLNPNDYIKWLKAKGELK